MTFHESAARGDITTTLQTAVVYGSLWAIGSSWSTAIREIVVTVMPDSDNNRILAELGSAALTTVFGVAVAVITTRNFVKCCSTTEETHKPPVNHANTLAKR